MVIILKKLKMEFEKLKIDGLVLCKPKIIEDDRGFFAETFRKDLLEDFISEKLDFCQKHEFAIVCDFTQVQKTIECVGMHNTGCSSKHIYSFVPL